MKDVGNLIRAISAETVATIRADARREALEEAAKVCEELHARSIAEMCSYPALALDCTAAIRALITSAPPLST